MEAENGKKLIFDKIDKFPRISQWFVSLEGEGENVGEPSLYLRLAGCYSAACSFCDTKFSWGEAQNNKSVADVPFLKEIDEATGERLINRMTITGGEPLHYVDSFFDIVNTIQTHTVTDLKHVGFESNGNLLSDKDITLDLIKAFNKIQNIGIIPSLTISPKMETFSCYEGQLSQEDVELMYSKVFLNVLNYMIPVFRVNFKFIYGVNELEDALVEATIKQLLEKGVLPKNIFLMPFTPEDPLDADKETWEDSKRNTSRKALELGIRYSPRIHVDNQLD